MKTIALIAILIISTILLSFSVFDNDPEEEINWNDCVKKYNSEWGEPCKGCTYSSDIYKAYFKNVCDKNVDALISVQEESGKWNCYYIENMAPDDTTMVFACKGTGKFLLWVKKAGDKEITFPKCHEVNEEYK